MTHAARTEGALPKRRPGGRRFGRSARLAAVLSLLGASPVGAASPWLPEPGRLEVGSSVLYERFDRFFLGTREVGFPPGDFEQVTALASAEYGVFDHLSLDLSVGYVHAFGDIPDNGGLADTSLGATFELLDEFEFDSPFIPSAALRVGGIVQGSYRARGRDFPGIPGDEASGFESELAVGRTGLPLDLGLSVHAGIRARTREIPIEWHLRVGAFRTFFDALTLGLAYDQWRAESGLDIDDAGFTPDRFRALQEVSENVEASIGYTDRAGRSIGFQFVKTVGGRNTGDRETFGLYCSIPFQLSSGD